MKCFFTSIVCLFFLSVSMVGQENLFSEDFENVRNSVGNLGDFSLGVYDPSGKFGECLIDTENPLAGNKSAKVTIERHGSDDWVLQLRNTVIQVEAGKSYDLSFKFKATNDVTVSVVVESTEGLIQQVSMPLNANQTENLSINNVISNITGNLRLVYFLSPKAGISDEEKEKYICTYWLDDVKVKETGTDIVIYSYDFETAEATYDSPVLGSLTTENYGTIAAWGARYIDEIIPLSGSKSAVLNVINPGVDDWELQLHKKGIPVEGGKIYDVSFKMRSEKKTKLFVRVESGGFIQDEFISLEPAEIKDVSFSFSLTESKPVNIIWFFSAPAGEPVASYMNGRYWLDDIVIKEHSNSSLAEQFAGGEITKISVLDGILSVNTQQEVQLHVYNPLGQYIDTLKVPEGNSAFPIQSQDRILLIKVVNKKGESFTRKISM